MYFIYGLGFVSKSKDSPQKPNPIRPKYSTIFFSFSFPFLFFELKPDKQYKTHS
jgi:hypothetical protein